MTSDQHDWFLLSASGVAGFEDYYTWRNCALEVDGSRRYINNWVNNSNCAFVLFIDNVIC